MFCTSLMNKREPEVEVKPRGRLLIDDELHISIRGLCDSQPITVHTVIKEEKKSIESCCCFRADQHGTVDLCGQPSLSGSYIGVSPMGIFWSMVPTSDMRKGFRLMKGNMDTPLVAEMSVYNGHLTSESIRDTMAKPITSHVIERWYKGEGVTCVDITHKKLRGKLYLPKGPGPFIGVIDLFGTAGGIIEYRSALLASRGIASLTLPYFMYKDLPEKLEDIELDYFIEAVNWMVKHKKIKGPGIGVIGVSRGADLGFILAAHCPEVRAFININGCAFNAGLRVKFTGGDIPGVGADFEKVVAKDDALAAKDMFTWSAELLTPVWRHNPKVLNFVCEDDAFVPGENIYFMKKHYPKDKVDNFIIQSYPGAGHLLEPPYTPLCSMSYHRAFGTYFKWGGQPKPHADAQEDAWRKTLSFFHTHLPGSHCSNKANL